VNRNDAASVMDSGRPRVKSRTRAEEGRRPRGTQLHANSREFKLAERTRADLAASLGGDLSTMQRLLVDQAVAITVRLWQSNAKLESGKAASDAETKGYVALANSLQRILLRLGKSSPAKVKATPSLADHLARHAAAVP